MRQSLTVHIPQNQDVSYSLYALGSKIAVSILSDDQSEYIFKFTAGTPVVLFYTFQNINRAFVVIARQNERDGDPVTLLGVDGKLCLIASFKRLQNPPPSWMNFLNSLLPKTNITSLPSHFCSGTALSQ